MPRLIDAPASDRAPVTDVEYTCMCILFESFCTPTFDIQHSTFHTFTTDYTIPCSLRLQCFPHILCQCARCMSDEGCMSVRAAHVAYA